MYSLLIMHCVVCGRTRTRFAAAAPQVVRVPAALHQQLAEYADSYPPAVAYSGAGHALGAGKIEETAHSALPTPCTLPSVHC